MDPQLHHWSNEYLAQGDTTGQIVAFRGQELSGSQMYGQRSLQHPTHGQPTYPNMHGGSWMPPSVDMAPPVAQQPPQPASIDETGRRSNAGPVKRDRSRTSPDEQPSKRMRFGRRCPEVAAGMSVFATGIHQTAEAPPPAQTLASPNPYSEYPSSSPENDPRLAPVPRPASSGVASAAEQPALVSFPPSPSHELDAAPAKNRKGKGKPRNKGKAKEPPASQGVLTDAPVTASELINYQTSRVRHQTWQNYLGRFSEAQKQRIMGDMQHQQFLERHDARVRTDPEYRWQLILAYEQQERLAMVDEWSAYAQNPTLLGREGTMVHPTQTGVSHGFPGHNAPNLPMAAQDAYGTNEMSPPSQWQTQGNPNAANYVQLSHPDVAGPSGHTFQAPADAMSNQYTYAQAPATSNANPPNYFQSSNPTLSTQDFAAPTAATRNYAGSAYPSSSPAFAGVIQPTVQQYSQDPTMQDTAHLATYMVGSDEPSRMQSEAYTGDEADNYQLEYI